MKINILMNCRNSENYICHTLRSLEKQTITDYQVILVDNRSSDNTIKCLDFFKSLKSRTRIIATPKPLKLYEARNYGISLIDNGIVFFLDSDDIWSDNYLEQVMQTYKSKEVMAVQTKVESFGHRKKGKCLTKHFRHKEKITQNKLADGAFPGISGLSVRTEFLKDYRFPNEYDYMGDIDLILKLCNSERLVYIDTCKMRYRLHGSSLTQTRLDTWAKELIGFMVKNEKSINNKLRKRMKGDHIYLETKYLTRQKPIDIKKIASSVIDPNTILYLGLISRLKIIIITIIMLAKEKRR